MTCPPHHWTLKAREGMGEEPTPGTCRKCGLRRTWPGSLANDSWSEAAQAGLIARRKVKT